MITFRQLQILREVARRGSFRRCGESLGLSQVSVSEQIRALEDRLRVPLFVRTPGAPPTLTEQGHVALWHAERALEAVSDLVAAVTPAPDGRTLRMAIHSFLMGDLRPVLDTFRNDHPDIVVEIDTAAHLHEELLESVRTRKLDAALFFTAGDHVLEDAPVLREEPLAIFVGAAHRLATRSHVTVDDLVGEPTVRLSNPLGDAVFEALASIGIVRPSVAIATEDFGLVVHSLKGGDCYACMFEATTEACTAMGLAKLDMQAAMPSLHVRLLTRRHLRRERAFVDLLDRMTDAWARRAEARPV